MPDIQTILKDVRDGRVTLEAAAALLNQQGVELGFAHLDTDRARRRGLPEVIYSPGKTSAQLLGIINAMATAGQDVFATRATREQFEIVVDAFPKARYHETARAITLDIRERPQPSGCVAVVCAGTSDLPVAEEAALAAERMHAAVDRISDVGVAGLHRIVGRLERLRRARAIVVVAGMEGALPSVVAGLVARPVIAVPTSVGYGAHFGGTAALLTMLNSCVPGITVVNIDNGFGAGVAAGMINRLGAAEAPAS